MTIPVICDRCRIAGTAGTGDFSHLGDLLDFEPVKVRHRVNGWDPDAQRAFIALLATTGSKRRAAQAIGRNAFGIDQLLQRPDAAGFRAAYERALAIAQQNGAMKLATGLADTAARNAQLTPPSRLRNLPSPQRGRGWSHEVAEGEGAEISDDEHEELSIALLRQYLMKVQLERAARLAGRVVEADFCLRQVTFFEVAMDLAQDAAPNREGIDTWTWLSNLRRDGHGLIEIAQTPFSRFLDDARRLTWSGAIDPSQDRPEHPPARYLVDRDGYSLEVGGFIQGGPDFAKREREMEEEFRKQAAAQIEWEQRATSAFSPLPSEGEGGSPCDPGEGPTAFP